MPTIALIDPSKHMNLEEILEYSAYDVAVVRWALALLVVILVMAVLGLVKRIVMGRIRKLAEKNRFRGLKYVEAIFSKTAVFLFLAIGLVVGISAFEITDRFVDRGMVVAQVLVAIQIGIWLSAACTVFISRYIRKIEDDAAQVTMFSAIKFVIKLVVWSIIFLMILDNLGFDITAMIASLGIGGIAIALAAQNILGDLFAFFSIIVDKPFVQGDFIIVDDHLGAIEHIGIKTTRIRSLSGEQLIFSNQDLLTSRIRNFKRMQERRVLLELGVTYDTGTEELREIPEIVRQHVEDEELARFDRAHFKALGESSLRFEIVYWVLDADFNVHMDVQQSLLLALVEEFRDREIHFAFPTRTVHFGEDEAYGDRPGDRRARSAAE